MPTGCGVNSHAEECLCDVNLIGTVVATTDLALRDRWFGHSILEYKGWDEALMGEDDLLEFFLMQVAAKDASAAPVPRKPLGGWGAGRHSKLTPEMNRFIGERVVQNAASGVIRKEVDERYGVQLSQSHMSHLRKRLVQKWA